MNQRKFISALVLFNVAIFVIATLFLPSAGSFSYHGPLSYYLNSRTDWYIAYGVLLASSLISWGVCLMVASFRETKKDDGDQ